MRRFIQSLPHPIANALLFARRWRTSFFEDGLLTIASADFHRDPTFVRAYTAAKATGSFANWHVRWRLHVLTWFARMATRVDGDFVECGVDHGGTATAILELTKINDRTFWLLDTFNGLDRTPATDRFLDYKECFARVQRTFADRSNVRLIRGSVPSTLKQVTASQIAFLHLDMNAMVPEIAALEHFWPLMPNGAVVVMDDYGWPRHHEQKAGFDRFAAASRVNILQLPTGQGVMLK